MNNLKSLRTVSSVVNFTLIILLISSYFDLELPLETLLAKLKSKLLFSIIAGISIALMNEWMLKKGKFPSQKRIICINCKTKSISNVLIIHDMKAKLQWKYDHNASGSVLTSPDSLIKSLMKNASRKFPFKK